MCMLDDCEPVTMLAQSTPTANKLHRCSECRRFIIPGERYTHERFAFEGKVSTHKTCPHCLVLREWLRLECGGYAFGLVLEDFLEHGHDGMPLELRRLRLMATRHWFHRLRGLYPVPQRPKTTDERLLEARAAL